MDSFFKDAYVIKFLRKLKVVLLSREWLWTVFKNCMSIFWERRNIVFRLSRTSFYFNFRVFSIPLKLTPKYGRMISIYFSCCSLQKLWFLVETFKDFFLKKMFHDFFYFLLFNFLFSCWNFLTWSKISTPFYHCALFEIKSISRTITLEGSPCFQAVSGRDWSGYQLQFQSQHLHLWSTRS